MTGTRVMADMSTLASLVEGDGVEVLGFYIGGDTPNVPPIADVEKLGARYLLPIFTRSNPETSGASVETDAQTAIKRLGLIGAPKGCLVGLDFEMAIDATYVTDFDAILEAAGYKVVLYGSRSDVLKNPRPSGGYWDADWTKTPHLNEGSTATQYASDQELGRPYDLSLIAADAPLWDRQVTKPTPTPTPASDPKVVALQKLLNAHGADLQEDGEKGPLTKGAFSVVMSRYGTIVEGNSGLPVEVLQAMLNTWYDVVTLPALAVDGRFGPKTLASVEEFQVKRDVKNSVANGKGDGRVGPNTKAALAV